MELKYIWIEEYKNLKKIDFNFNHSVDETFNYADGILTVTKISKNRCEDFFSHNIKGLTAIVGKNGSGKTNLSEFLNYNLAHVTNLGLSTYEEGNGIIVIGKYVFVQEKISIGLSKELENDGYQISKFKKAPLDNNPSELNWSYLEKNKYIYYNPAFDFRILPMANNWDNIWNISTSYLAWNDISQSNKHRNVAPSAYKRENRTDLLYAHARNEKIRESEIILNYPNISDLIGDLPTEMKISLDNQKENKMMVIPDYSNEDADSKHLNQLRGELDKSMPYLLDTHLLKEYEKELKSDTISVYKIPGDIRMQYFERFFWIGFFRIYQNLNKSEFALGLMSKFIFEEKNYFNGKESRQFESLKNKLKELLGLCDFGNGKEHTINSAESYEEYTSSLFKLLGKATISLDSTKKKSILKQFINKTRDILNGEIPFHYEFNHKLSTGQQNILNFHSRFYWASNEIRRNEKGQYGILGERVVIFIDEGEVSYHPEWQRRFFKKAIEFLSELFKGKELQLIFTTHSPFVLSDIPINHVIFLDKDDEGNAVKVETDMEKTFGANIYSLLSDSFFMKNGTIGEFAKEKIQKVIKILSSDSIDAIDDILNEVNYIIENVGEPIIKQQLEILRDNKINETKVSALEKKVKDLQNKLDRRNDQDKNQ